MVALVAGSPEAEAAIHCLSRAVELAGNCFEVVGSPYLDKIDKNSALILLRISILNQDSYRLNFSFPP